MKLNIQLGDKTTQIEIDKPNPVVQDLIQKSRDAGLYCGHRPCFMFGGKVIQAKDFVTKLSDLKITDGITLNITHRFGTCDDNCGLSCAERDIQEKEKRKEKIISLRDKFEKLDQYVKCQICDERSILHYPRFFDPSSTGRLAEIVKLTSGEYLNVFGTGGLDHYGGTTVLINVKTGLQACGSCWKFIITKQ